MLSRRRVVTVQTPPTLGELRRRMIQNVPKAERPFRHRDRRRVEILTNALLALDIDDDAIATDEHIEARALPNVLLVVEPLADQLPRSVHLTQPADRVGRI